MNRKVIEQAMRTIGDILICDGGVDHFSDAIRETQKVIKELRITDLETTQEVWKRVAKLHFDLIEEE